MTGHLERAHRTEIEINAPADAVWSVMSDVERWPEWTASIRKVRRLDDGEFRVGSRARINQPKLMPATWTVDTLQPGRSFSWSTRSPGLHIVGHHVVEPLADDRSKVTLTTVATGALAGIADSLTGKLAQRYIETEAAGLKPAPRADERTLQRRLALALTGLPPDRTWNTAPDSQQARVEHYLASPHYGERWARHWLDMARYADSDGYEKDNPRKDAWRYRDYVIRSLNAGKPFDRLTMAQAIMKYNPQYTEAQLNDMEFLRNAVKKAGEEVRATDGLGLLQLKLFEANTEEKLIQPTFITQYPAEVSFLARRNEVNPEVTDRFEFFVYGREIGNAFSELNDAEDQAARFRAQVERKDAALDAIIPANAKRCVSLLSTLFKFIDRTLRREIFFLRDLWQR